MTLIPPIFTKSRDRSFLKWYQFEKRNLVLFVLSNHSDHYKVTKVSHKHGLWLLHFFHFFSDTLLNLGDGGGRKLYWELLRRFLPCWLAGSVRNNPLVPYKSHKKGNNMLLIAHLFLFTLTALPKHCLNFASLTRLKMYIFPTLRTVYENLHVKRLSVTCLF